MEVPVNQKRRCTYANWLLKQFTPDIFDLKGGKICESKQEYKLSYCKFKKLLFKIKIKVKIKIEGRIFLKSLSESNISRVKMMILLGCLTGPTKCGIAGVIQG